MRNSKARLDALRKEFEERTAIIHGYLVDNRHNPTGKPSFGWVLRIPDNECRKEIKLIPANQLPGYGLA